MRATILFLSIFLGLFSFVGHSVTRTELLPRDTINKAAAHDLDVALVADKASYKAKDRIRLIITLTNNNPVNDIFVYGTLEFGYRGSLTLYRRDAKGKEVPTRMIDEALEFRPKPEDTTAFVKLLPFHFIGTTYRSSIYLLNLERPGRYSMWVEYRSPISNADVKLSPFWSAESGPIRSNVVHITVGR